MSLENCGYIDLLLILNYNPILNFFCIENLIIKILFSLTYVKDLKFTDTYIYYLLFNNTLQRKLNIRI